MYPVAFSKARTFLLTLCLAANSTALLAQTTNSPAQPRRPAAPDRSAPQGRAFAGGTAASRFAPGLERVASVLTDEQRESMREIMEQTRPQMRDLEEKLRQSRLELFDNVGKPFDEEKVRAGAMAVAKLEAELTVMRAKAISQLRPPLSPEQIASIKQALPARPDDVAAPIRRRTPGPRDEHDLPPKDRPEPEEKQPVQPK